MHGNFFCFFFLIWIWKTEIPVCMLGVKWVIFSGVSFLFLMIDCVCVYECVFCLKSLKDLGLGPVPFSFSVSLFLSVSRNMDVWKCLDERLAKWMWVSNRKENTLWRPVCVLSLNSEIITDDIFLSQMVSLTTHTHTDEEEEEQVRKKEVCGMKGELGSGCFNRKAWLIDFWSGGLERRYSSV